MICSNPRRPVTSGWQSPRSGGIIITRDKRLRFDEAERRAIVEARLGCFVLLSPKLTRWTMARLLLPVWDQLEAIVAQEARPFIDGVHADGTVRPLRLRPPKGSPAGLRREQ
jgi:hypothetical protein